MSRRYLLLPGLCATLALAACDEANDAPRAVGQLESDRVELIAEFSEPITEWYVREGDAVTAGQLILGQDPARAKARIAEQQARLDGARARLAELTRGPRQEQISAAGARVEAQRRELEFRQRDYERAHQVFERDLSSVEAVDQAKTLLDTAAATLKFEEAGLAELLTGTTIEELDQATAMLRQAEAILASAEIDLQRHDTLAPVDALVDTLPFEVGERPQPGQPVAILLAGTQPYARAYIPESLRTGVRKGDTVRVFVDGLATPLTGRVRWVASDAAFTPYFALTQHDRGRLTYAAKIDVEYDDGRLPDGVPVEVEITSGSPP